MNTAPASTAGELRRSPRRSMALPVTILFKDLAIKGCHTRDIGFGGAHVQTSITAPPENAVVTVVLEREHQPPIQLLATVVYRVPGGVGLQFRKIENRIYGNLVDLIYGYAQGSSPASVTVRRPTDVPGGHTFWKSH